LGGEFQVNTYTQHVQDYSNVAMDGAGNFVVVWQSDKGPLEVDGRRYTADGTALTDQFQVNTTAIGYQPSIGMSPDGAFVVAWTGQDASGRQDVMARRYDADGQPLGDDFLVYAQSAAQREAAVAMNGDDSFVVAWTNYASGSSSEVYARRYNAAGTPLGDTFRVNTLTPGLQGFPALAMDADGRFTITWLSQDGGQWNVYAQRYDSGGQTIGSQFQVNTPANDYQPYAAVYPAIAMAPTGKFVIAWETSDGNCLSGIHARLFAADDVPLSDDFTVPEEAPSCTTSQNSAAVGMDSRGNFVVTWNAYPGDGDGAVNGRLFDAAGNVLGGGFQVNTYTSGSQSTSAVAMNPTGKFVVTWTSVGQDGEGGGIYGQRFDGGFDSSPPVTAITLDPPTPDGGNGWYRHVSAAVSASDGQGGSGVEETRCVLDPVSVPVSFDDLPEGCPYLGAGADVPSEGQHTLYAASEDSAGNKETPVSSSFKIDKTPPTVNFTDCPPASPVVLGSSVTVHWSASDATSGLSSASSGTVGLATSPAGVHSVPAPPGTDKAGNSSGSISCTYVVQYKILGFFSPAPSSKWKAGSNVPVKIALADATGGRISDAEAAGLASECRVTFRATGAQTLAGQCMKYDASVHQFIYSWKLGATTGAETIYTDVSYPSRATKTTKSEGITITR